MSESEHPQNKKSILDFMKCIKKCFRKALKHGNHLPTLFNLVVNFINLRFLAYLKLFGESSSQNDKKRILNDSDGFYMSLSGLDLTYDDLTKLLINENEDEEVESYHPDIDDDTEAQMDIEIAQSKDVDELCIENKIAIIFYILHHNEMIFEWMECNKGDFLASGFDISEIEIQRFKDFNIKQLLDYVEEKYSREPIENSNNEVKESIYSKMLKLCMFQVPQYFNNQVLMINHWSKNGSQDVQNRYIKLSAKYSLTCALEALNQDSESLQINTYYQSLSEKPYVTAITVIRFFGRRYRRFKIRYSFDEFFHFYQDYGVYNILFSESFHNQLFGNLKKQKRITSLSWFNFNLSEWVLNNEPLLGIWCDWIGILLDVEYHQTLKKMKQFEFNSDSSNS